MWGSLSLTGAAGHPEPTLMIGQITQAPGGFTDPLQISIPGWQANHFFTITDWPADHGATLPDVGDACLVAMEPVTRQIWLLRWAGTYS